MLSFRRGIGSINAGTTPLIVLDGLPYSGYWTGIDPADVESITVLKDAASNALYGARGANGVIFVYDVPEGQYLIGENGRLNPNAKLGNVVHYAGQDYLLILLIPDDWSDYGIRNGIRKEYNLNLNGGNDRYSSYGSLGYLGNEGICYGSELERYTARLKTEYQAYPWLKIGANAGYTHSDSNNMSGAFSVCHNIAPIYPLFIRDANGNILTDADGSRYDYGDGGTPD